MKKERSKILYEQAKKYIPGGVNSPVRAFKSVGMDPIFIEKASGSRIWDVDGNEYIDYICSWGPLLLGHSPSFLIEGLQEVALRGTSYGAPTALEIDMAKMIVEAYPAIDQVRMVNSGTEATMSALRVARAATKREKILKFEGNYHGHADALLVKSGSGALTYGVPTSPGISEDLAQNTIVARYNDIADVKEKFKEYGADLAAVIIETVAGNMGLVASTKDFLQTLRELCTEHGTILIFDEVITGFRLGYGSSPEWFDIEPDMACFGKIIGGGLPVGAYGGKQELMDWVAPVGPVYQAGTLSGNPLAMHIGYKMLNHLKNNPHIYDELEQNATRLATGIRKILNRLGLDYTVNQLGSLVTLFFTNGPVESYDDVMRCDIPLFNKYFAALLERGVLLPPTQYEAMFLSHAHTKEDIDLTLDHIEAALKIAHDL